MNITTPFTLKHHFCLRATIVACLIGVVAWAQPQKFQKVYGGYSYDQGNDLIQLPDTGYLLLCTSGSFSSSADIYLLKVDKQGNYEWQHTYGGQDIEGACKIKLTQDGHIAMAGHTNSYPGKSYDFYLVKAALNGDTVWTKHYGSNEWDFANSMDTCADGGFIMAGKTYDTGNAFSDILIVKTDADGNELWQKKIGGNKDDVANSIISLVDGYILCGTTESIGAGGKDIYVVKVDLNGNVIWERTLGGAEDDVGESILLDYFNSVLIIGGNTKSYGIPQNFNFLLQKIDLDGTIINSNFISTVNSNYYLKDITLKTNGNIVICGDVDFFNSTDYMLLEYTNSFDFVVGTTYGAFYQESSNAIISTSDGGICSIGFTKSFASGMDNVYLVKCDTLLTNVGVLQNLVGVDDISIQPESTAIFFPNPSIGLFSITLKKNPNSPNSIGSKEYKFELFNSLGEYILIDNPRINIVGGLITYNFNQRELPDGTYLLRIYEGEELLESKKIIIVK